MNLQSQTKIHIVPVFVQSHQARSRNLGEPLGIFLKTGRVHRDVMKIRIKKEIEENEEKEKD